MTDASQILQGLAELQAEAAAGRGLPPVERWNPAHCGKIPMRIARDGSWHYMGTPILRPALVRLFSTILRREPDGSHVLVTPVEKAEIVVDDAPFVAVRVDAAGAGRDQQLTFLTNVGDTVAAGEGHGIVTRDGGDGPRPYLHVRRGLDALIARAVFYELADLAVAGENGAMGVWSGGVFFPLGQGA